MVLAFDPMYLVVSLNIPIFFILGLCVVHSLPQPHVDESIAGAGASCVARCCLFRLSCFRFLFLFSNC